MKDWIVGAVAASPASSAVRGWEGRYMRITRERRTTGRMGSILTTIGLVAGMLAVLAPDAGAAGVKTCSVKNTTLAKTYGPANGSVLQDAINGAASGNSLLFALFCVIESSVFGRDRSDPAVTG